MRKSWFFTAAFICIVPVIYNLLKPGFYVSDDGEWMVIRFTSFYQELVNGQFPVRFLERLNHGYGYPVATFLYPGFMYLATSFKAIGLTFVTSIKMLLIGSVISAFLGTFLWLSMRFSKRAAFIGAVMFIYHPYFLWDIYKRGSVGEVLTLGLLPFVLYFLEKRLYAAAAVVSGMVLISHNTLALFYFPFSILYYFFLQFEKKVPVYASLKNISVFVLLSLGISAFFWIPAIFELSYTIFGETSISNWHEYFVTSVPLLGVAHLIILATFCVLVFRKRVKIEAIIVFMVITALFSLFLSTQLSYLLWMIFPFGTYIQFPFRFLSLFIPAAAFLSAWVFNLSNILHRQYFLIGIVSLIIIGGIPFVPAVSYTDRPDGYYQTNEATTTVQDEYMPIWVRDMPDTRAEAKITRIDESTIQINTVYWPGHEVYVNGVFRSIDYTRNGFIQVESFSDSDVIKLLFKETPLRLMADFITLISFITTLFLIKKRYV